MIISPINDISFNAKLKIKQLNKSDIIQGTATSLIGTASLMLGVDSLTSNEYSSITEKAENFLYSAKEVENKYGIVKIEYSKYADSMWPTPTFLLPIGLLSIGIGLDKITEAYSKNEKQIPD